MMNKSKYCGITRCEDDENKKKRVKETYGYLLTYVVVPLIKFS